MSISISVRNKPFLFGKHVLSHLPYSPYSIEAFVSEVHVGDVVFPLNNSIPFTLTLDLEKGCVFFENTECRYRIAHEGHELICIDLKNKTEMRNAVPLSSYARKAIPRISFGCHKKQDVALICSRKQLDEYLPFLYHLGKTFEQGEVPCEGIAIPLYAIKDAIDRKEKTGLKSLWDQFFTLGCASLFFVDPTDAAKAGIGMCSASSQALLAFAAELIEAMLTQEGVFLPALPTELHAGRFVSGPLDFEWSKKAIKKAVIKPNTHEKKVFSHRFRCNGSFQNELTLEPGQIYFLDRFQK